MTTLSLRNITKRFKTNTVLDDLSLDVADGETLVLFGPSGAGKTVLLRLIAGVIDPDQGKIVIGGEDVTDVDAEFRGIGMAFQNFALFPHMSAFDNIATPLDARGECGPSRHQGRRPIGGQTLEDRPCAVHHPKALSNGQKQRTALARALAGSPPYCCCSTIPCAMSTPSCASRCGWNCRACWPSRAQPSSMSRRITRKPWRSATGSL
jgi:multiple sugar transport system ATP-binding protein